MFVDKARESRPRGATLLHLNSKRFASVPYGRDRASLLLPFLAVSQSAPPPFLSPTPSGRTHPLVILRMRLHTQLLLVTLPEPSPSAKSCAKLDPQVSLPALPLLHPAPRGRLRHSTRTVLPATPSPTRPTSLQAYTVEHFTHAKTLGEYDDGGEWSGYKY